MSDKPLQPNSALAQVHVFRRSLGACGARDTVVPRRSGAESDGKLLVFGGYGSDGGLPETSSTHTQFEPTKESLHSELGFCNWQPTCFQGACTAHRTATTLDVMERRGQPARNELGGE
jgi:hypothetical protein